MERVTDAFRFDLWIQREMDRRGWDDLDMELASGLNFQTIRYYREGKRTPNMSSLLMVLDALGKRMEFVDK